MTARGVPGWAWALEVAGVALVIGGTAFDGYGRDVVLEFGAALCLVVPLLIFERWVEGQLADAADHASREALRRSNESMRVVIWIMQHFGDQAIRIDGRELTVDDLLDDRYEGVYTLSYLRNRLEQGEVQRFEPSGWRAIAGTEREDLLGTLPAP